MSEPARTDEPDDWAVGWDTHRLEQQRLWLLATPAQRLAWLEDMIQLAYRSGALPRPRRD